ncbi:NlpC/P60 family protein [Roseateles sp. L2-2]|uniref:C40 family peptidase n=1 Tax=Roseateles sp. L2-2 TaxID=3422597 RepID=UPI003D36559B
MAALGLICVFASGSCWAQQSTSSTTESQDKPKAQAKAAPAKAAAKPAAKPATKKTAEAKSTTKSAKDGKDAKSSKQVASKDAGKDKKTKADEDKSPSTEIATEKTVAEKASADKVASAKPETKSSDKVASVKTEARDAKSEAAPPAGTMMGAYGQSLMRSPAAATAAVTTVAAAGTAAALVAPTAAAANNTTPTATASLPPTALMGAAAGNANASESVARFLQQRGIVAQAQTSSPATPGADAPAPGLLNRVRDNASDLVLSAMNFLGVPYKRGGNSVNNGFDCSGFTRHIFEMSVGLVLPRRADEQAKLSSLVPIKKEDLKPGDLVFFNTMRATFSHVGIYVGEGKFIHSPRVGGAVRVEDMREAYWAKRFTGARRADLNQANPGT